MTTESLADRFWQKNSRFRVHCSRTSRLCAKSEHELDDLVRRNPHGRRNVYGLRASKAFIPGELMSLRQHLKPLLCVGHAHPSIAKALESSPHKRVWKTRST